MFRPLLRVLAAVAVVLVFAARLPAQGDAPAPKATMPTKKAPPELLEAAARFRNRDFPGALQLLQKMVKENPDLAPPQLFMANFWADAGQMAGLRACLQQATLDDPTDPEAYQILADLDRRSGQMAEATLLYAKADELLTSNRKLSEDRRKQIRRATSVGLAASAEWRRDLAKAQEHLEAIAAVQPKDAQVLSALGQILFAQKKYDHALARFKAAQASTSEPKPLPAAAVMAQLYHRLAIETLERMDEVAARAADLRSKRREDEAVKLDAEAATLKKDAEELAALAKRNIREAVGEDVNNAKSRLAYAQWAMETGLYEAADTEAKRALDMPKDNPSTSDGTRFHAKMLIGTVAMLGRDKEKDKYKRAAEYFTKANTDSPYNFAASNMLALALAEQKDAANLQRAAEYAAVNVQRDQNNPQAWATLGRILFWQRKYKEAEQAFARSINSTNVTAETRYYLADLLAKLADEAPADQAKLLLDNAKAQLQAAVRTRRPFLMRPEAEDLLAALAAKTPAKAATP